MVRPQQDAIAYDRIRAIEWESDRIKLIDQRLLPGRLQYLYVESLHDTAEAIRDMVVRGAPAIGITAAYGVVLGAQARYRADAENWRAALAPDLELLGAARPTAVNLRWAVARMRGLIETLEGDPVARLLAEAQRIHAEDIAANRRMGELGAALIEPGSTVLTHCNAGALATGGYGTALGVVRAGAAAGRIAGVYASETRPWLQGARLTAWELVQEGIPVTVTAEGAAASLMREQRVQWVIVGADRIAANADVANKIGTYAAALAARQHGVKFMVVAPTSTIDMATESGADIPIETRGEDEVLEFAGQRMAPEGARAWNPAFDITPAELIDAIVTEKGVVLRPARDTLAASLRGPR
ncbi:MAG: S-methyl-5-thioribose-1-phosphate isomerase [Gammaproteobacteria bacterium]|nr:MAG: S-methyl-5-thioribose-1-phosphate isomerase [Gammaproteobacteria bacterium]